MAGAAAQDDLAQDLLLHVTAIGEQPEEPHQRRRRAGPCRTGQVAAVVTAAPNERGRGTGEKREKESERTICFPLISAIVGNFRQLHRSTGMLDLLWWGPFGRVICSIGEAESVWMNHLVKHLLLCMENDQMSIIVFSFFLFYFPSLCSLLFTLLPFFSPH